MTTNLAPLAVPVDYTFSFYLLLPHLLYNLQSSVVNFRLYKSVEIRFTFRFRFQYVKELWGISARSGNPRAWTSVPGRFPSFLPYRAYRDQRIAAPANRHLTSEPRSTADLRPLMFCFRAFALQKGGVLGYYLETSFLKLFLQKGGVPFDLLDLRLRSGRAAS